MKKITCIILTMLLILSSSIITAFARDERSSGKKDLDKVKETFKNKDKEIKEHSDRNDSKKENDEKKLTFDEKSVSKSVYKDVYKDELKDELKDKFKDLKDGFKEFRDKLKALKKEHKKERKELMKQIIELRKAKSDHSTPVFVNGQDVEFDVPPVIKEGRTLIPVRAVTNALGADVKWDQETKTVTITKSVQDSVYNSVYNNTPSGNITIVIKLDSDIVQVNGQSIKIEVPAQLVSNRTMVPLRLIGEALKKEVQWDKELSSVVIDD